MNKINLEEIKGNGGGVEFSPFDVKVFHGAFNVLRNTDEAEFLTTEIFPANHWEETPELRAKVMESLRKIDAAGLLFIPELHKEKRADGGTPYYKPFMAIPRQTERRSVETPDEARAILMDTAFDACNAGERVTSWIENDDFPDCEDLMQLKSHLTSVSSVCAKVASLLSDFSRGGTTWYGLDAKGMASVLDYFFDTDALENDMWNELFEMYGSPYRVDYYDGGAYAEARPVATKGGGEAKAGKAPGNALHWSVEATDEQGEPITMGAFYTKSDAEEYAHWLQSADWKATVKEIA